jgi:hypothetical protein
MVPLPNEAQQYNDQSQQLVINGNPSGHFWLPSLLSSVPPPPPPPSSEHLPPEVELPFQALNLNPVLPPQSHETNTHSILENNDLSLFTGSAEGNNYPADGSQSACMGIFRTKSSWNLFHESDPVIHVMHYLYLLCCTSKDARALQRKEKKSYQT